MSCSKLRKLVLDRSRGDALRGAWLRAPPSLLASPTNAAYRTALTRKSPYEGGQRRNAPCPPSHRAVTSWWARCALPTLRTCWHNFTFSRRVASEFFHQPSLLKTEGAGKTGRRLAPMVRVQQKSTRQNHRFSRKRPAFPAQLCYGLYVLSPVTRLCCHRCLASSRKV